MKIDRRSFLSLVIGGAAGTALTPLPLKLTDDLSIWTQRFRYMPNEVPVPLDGAVSHETSVCALCPGGCGISVRKIDNRAVKIEGRKDCPVNEGGICTLGLAGLQLLYGPWRVKTPLKKNNGQFEQIGWDQALSEISDRLNELKNSGNPQAVAGIARTGNNTTGQLLKRLLTVLGSPNFFTPSSSQDCTYILSFGSGLLEGWGSPVRMFQTHSRWKDNGTTLVQVEARLSNTAAKADTWVPIKPGTEGALAMGLAHIILRDGLHAAGIEGNSTSFDEFRRMLKKNYPPNAVAHQTGVDEPTLEKLARNFAGSSRPLAVCGRGAGQDPNGDFEAMAVMALNALVGAVNRSGGICLAALPDYINWPTPESSAAENKEPAVSPHQLIQLINGNPQSPVQALFVSDVNPLFTLHDTKAVQDAFDKIPLIVALSAYMDETAARADYVLPVHTYLERYEDIPVTAGLKKPLVGLTRPVVNPVFDTRHPGDVIIHLAKSLDGAMKAAFPWENHEACLKQTLAENWEILSSQGYLSKSTSEIEALTRAGKIDFSALIASAGNQEQTPAGQEETWPLTLIPYDSTRISGGHIGTPPFVLKTVSDKILKKAEVFVEINPVTARRHNLANGRPAILETPTGKARVMVNVTEEIVPDVIALPKGLGHFAYDAYLAGKGVNVNALIGPEEDPVSGLDVAWGVKAKLTQV